LKEDNGFASSPTDTNEKPWGADATYDTARGSNQALQVFEFGSRIPVDIVEQLFDGRWSVSFNYTNPWWMYLFYGSPSQTDNGDGSYTYTWDGESPGSIQIGIGREDSGKERILKGCVATSATISPSVGGMVNVTIEGAYAEETTEDPGSIATQPTIDHKPMTFADASLQLDGTTLGYVQEGSVQLQNETAIIAEWGTRVGIDYAPRTLLPTVNFTKINENGETDNLQRMYGSSTSTSVQNNVTDVQSMTFGLDNGVSAGSGINTLDVSFSGTFPDSYAENGLGDPEADVTEDINRLAESAVFSATNEKSSAA
jgi:hypothetical protein